jgi:hypothetical protein
MLEVDKGVGRPQRAMQLFTGHKLAGMLEKKNQDTERLVTDPDGKACAQKLVLARIDLKYPEAPGLRGLRRCFHQLTLCGLEAGDKFTTVPVRGKCVDGAAISRRKPQN